MLPVAAARVCAAAACALFCWTAGATPLDVLPQGLLRVEGGAISVVPPVGGDRPVTASGTISVSAGGDAVLAQRVEIPEVVLRAGDGSLRLPRPDPLLASLLQVSPGGSPRVADDEDRDAGRPASRGGKEGSGERRERDRHGSRDGSGDHRSDRDDRDRGREHRGERDEHRGRGDDRRGHERHEHERHEHGKDGYSMNGEPPVPGGGPVTPVPLPAALPLFAASIALLGVGGLGARARRNSVPRS